MLSSNPTPWARLKALLQTNRSTISQLYVYAILSGIINLSLPLGIQSVIYFIQGGQISTSWILLIVLVILGIFLTGMLQIMQLRLTENIQQSIFVRYSFDFAHRFPRLAISKEKNPLELVNRFFDVVTLQKGIAKVVLDFTSSSLQIVFSLLLLSFYHPFYIAFSFILLILIYLVFKPLIKQGFLTSLEESKYKYKTAYWLQQIARSNWTFRFSPDAKHHLNQLDEHAQAYLKSREHHFKILWSQYSWMIAIKSVIVAALLGLGGYLVIDQQLNLGQFVAAEVLILMLLGAVEKLIQSLDIVYDVFTSLEKLGQVEDLPTLYEATSSVENHQLFPFELVEKQGETIKSKFSINALQHTLVVCTDEKQVKQFAHQLMDTSHSSELQPRWNFSIPNSQDYATKLTKIGWYEQDIQLFDGTLKSNILLGRSQLNLTDLKLALDTVGLTHLLDSMPAGFDTPVSDYSELLTSEEKARISMASALVHQPHILLLSLFHFHVSNEEKTKLLSTIQQNYPNTTIVCINHDELMPHWKQLFR